MKGSIGIGRSLSITKRTSLILQSSFSTSSSGGRGRGRGGGASPFFQLTRALDLEESDSDVSKPRNSDGSPPIGLGHGRGRGKPISADPIHQSFVSSVSQTGSGRGRGQVIPESVPPPPQTPGQPKQPIFIKKNDAKDTDVSAKSPASESVRSSESMFSSQIFSASTSSGAGRGKPLKQPEPTPEEVRQQPPPPQQPPLPQLSMEDAAKKALGILSKGKERGMARGGGRGRDRGRGGGRGGGRGFGMGRDRKPREDLRVEEGNYAEGEKLAEIIGPENMSKFADAFEDMCSDLFPSPDDDAILEALHTNCLVSPLPF
ncbi:hypothetical protein COLO4_21461 [Corchorus olitorius]|uniref:Uncharacterized protein n=1 Tax=Corchorus olitorius TaxID=93759 RepID=A0A1R3IT71_9ROSI|nr:hypothetical protein COLO4_21461 [Corchorus olitorius]